MNNAPSIASVIDHLTASLKDKAAASDARVSTLRDEWVARMVQFGAVPILVASLLLTLHFYQTTPLRLSVAWACAMFNVLLSVVCLSLTLTKWFTRNWRAVSLVLLSALIAGNTGIGTVGDEPMLLYISLILLMVGAGALLPWSKRFQLCFNLTCLTSWVIQAIWTAEFDAPAFYQMAGLLTAAAMSYFTCYVRDRFVRDHEESERIIRESERTLRKIFDASLDWMSIVEMETGQTLDINASFARATGYKREEIIGSDLREVGVWPDEKEWQPFTQKLTLTGKVKNHAVTFKMKDGTLVPCLVSAVQCELWGKRCCISAARDITDLKEAENKHRKSETMLRAIFDASLDNIALLDLTSMTLVEVNAELTRVLGFTRDEMLGKTFEDLVPTPDPVRQQQLTLALMQGHEVRNFEMNLATRSGQVFPGLLAASTLKLDGRPYALAVSRDITDLVAAREAALAASRAKSEFLSIMSHEIRTPMNAILGMADLICESELNPEQRRYLDTILRNGNALLELINGILDLAKVESGRLSLEGVEFDLIDLTERAADTLAVRAHEKGVELAVRFAGDLPAMVTGDPHRMRQILINLIGNAIKFTTHGEVVVTAGLNLDDEVPGDLRFEVRDTGIGVAPDKIESIFTVFTQADTSTTRKFGGSGLGLAIVKRLVALMGGRVWVESEVGTGSSFFFTADLHIAQTHVQAPAPVDDARMRGLRALVADENATAREIVADLLRARGCIVAEAACETDVKTAIAAADRRGARFGLFLVDSEMKSRDGYEAMRRIRDLEPKAAMVMLTNSNGLPAKLRRMREQGVQHYTTKPIKRQELYEVIAEALSKSAPPPKLPKASRKVPASAPAPPAIVNRPLKILLADDSPDNRLLIRAYGKKYPFTFSEAENGQVAVDLFIEGDFDLVLMDIQMPVLGGYDAVRAIRKWELEQGKKRTPIIALTASALDGDVQRARDAGCDMHLSKPIKKTTLLEAIAHAIEEVAARPSVEANRAASSSHFHI